MCPLAGKDTPIHVIVYYPQTREGRQALAERVAGVQGEAVCQTLQGLDCPPLQREQLLAALLEGAASPTPETLPGVGEA